jgi:nucleotide-binding universal stress UspA family protein
MAHDEMLRGNRTGVESDPDPGGSFEREALQAIRNRLEYESEHFARYQIRIEPDHPKVAILREVETFKPDLLVMGTRGGGRLHRALLGSVANHVLHEVDCDILIVPQGSVGKPANTRPQPRWQRHPTSA